MAGEFPVDPIEDLCEQCQGEANVYCDDCNNSYCTTCSHLRHRAGKRREHNLIRISSVTNITHVSLDGEQCYKAGKETM